MSARWTASTAATGPSLSRSGGSATAAGNASQRLQALLAPSTPYRLNVQQCLDALGLLATATIAVGPVARVIGVPGASGATTPAETLAAHHQVPFHEVGDVPAGGWGGRVLVVCDSDRCPHLWLAVAELEEHIAPGGRVEVAVLVSHRACEPTPDWAVWRTDATVVFPWDPGSPDSTAARRMADPQRVYRSPSRASSVPRRRPGFMPDVHGAVLLPGADCEQQPGTACTAPQRRGTDDDTPR